MAMNVGATEVEVCSDSHFVVSQFCQDLRQKTLRMLEYLKVAQSMQLQFKSVKVTQISRGQNIHANSLATLASSVSGSIPLILVELIEFPSIDH